MFVNCDLIMSDEKRKQDVIYLKWTINLRL